VLPSVFGHLDSRQSKPDIYINFLHSRLGLKTNLRVETRCDNWSMGEEQYHQSEDELVITVETYQGQHSLDKKRLLSASFMPSTLRTFFLGLSMIDTKPTSPGHVRSPNAHPALSHRRLCIAEGYLSLKSISRYEASIIEPSVQ